MTLGCSDSARSIIPTTMRLGEILVVLSATPNPAACLKGSSPTRPTASEPHLRHAPGISSPPSIAVSDQLPQSQSP